MEERNYVTAESEDLFVFFFLDKGILQSLAIEFGIRYYHFRDNIES